MFFVYAIKSIDKKYIYVGLTNNLLRRFDEHQNGKNKTTKPYRPFIEFYNEAFATRPEARNREKFLKSGAGKEILKDLLKKIPNS
ncbi:MAG: GIY-YIG nuclease family protein [Chitinophagaceae bacterium]